LVMPSVDIRRGRVVQMVGGRPETERVYGEPLEMANRWIEQGAEWLHIVDLDAAMRTGDNLLCILDLIASVDVNVQVGGGIRNLARANELLNTGSDRIILGTAAIKAPEFVRQLVETFGGNRVMVALDSRSGKVVVEGWKKSTEKSVFDVASEFERVGVGSILFTKVDVEGSMSGVAAREIRELVNAVEIPVYASGGVGSLGDVRAAREAGAAGLVIGMALYEKKFNLKQAMEVALGESRQG